MRSKKRSYMYLILLMFVVISLLITLLYRIQVRSNRENAYRSSALLIDQLENVIDNNKDKLNSLTASLKDDYVTRAKAISYNIDRSPKIEKQLTELAWLTSLYSVDEIHLFDSSGRLYSGTKTSYYGENLKTSKHFEKFAKMLKERNFTMCEFVTDESTGKQIMYAICWNESHKRLVMVGVEPMRLLKELAASQMDAVIREIPAYEGVEIMVAGNDDVIQGATNDTYIGKSLIDLGINVSDMNTGELRNEEIEVRGEDTYFTIQKKDTISILVGQQRKVINANIPLPLVLVIIYMILAGIVIVFIVRKMTRRILNEQKNANSDAMTSFANRRAYENDSHRYDDREYEPTLVYVSMDLNGLKQVNDSRGHEAGDRLIIGAAMCIHQCFGNYGELYRIGGDEFAGLIFADEDRLTMIQMDFAEELDNWSKENGMVLTVSCGYVRAAEHHDLSFTEIAKLADDRMYEAKDAYYRRMKMTPR